MFNKNIKLNLRVEVSVQWDTELSLESESWVSIAGLFSHWQCEPGQSTSTLYASIFSSLKGDGSSCGKENVEIKSMSRLYCVVIIH